MGTRSNTSESPELLSGWKNIARHLGMGVRTVQRYERLMGLPVRRPAGRSRGSVVATKSEIDAWVAASPIREAFHLPKLTPDVETRRLERHIEEMRVLRNQMAELRAELKVSVGSLRNSIQGLRGDLRPGHWEAAAFSTLEENPQVRNLRKWLSTPTQRKLS